MPEVGADPLEFGPRDARRDPVVGSMENRIDFHSAKERDSLGRLKELPPNGPMFQEPCWKLSLPKLEFP